MSRNQSISDLPSRRDLFSLDDWNNTISLKNMERLARLDEAKDPLGWTDSLHPHSLWMFNKEDLGLEFLFGRSLDKHQSIADPFEDNRKTLLPLVRLSSALSKLLDRSREFNDVYSTISWSDVSKYFSDDVKIFKNFYLIRYDPRNINMTIIGMFLDNESKIPGGQTKADLGHQIDFLAGGYLSNILDYHIYRQPVWQNIPRSIFQKYRKNSHEAVKVYSDPFVYDPRDQNDQSIFLWPWQKCISLRKHNDQSLASYNHRQIETVSLVLDIRRSTTALSLTRKPAHFAAFIEELTHISKQVLIQNGGYFDKDTGDGISGHFCDDFGTIRGGYG